MANVQTSDQDSEKAYTKYYDQVQALPPRPRPYARRAYLLHPDTFRSFCVFTDYLSLFLAYTLALMMDGFFWRLRRKRVV